jgi:hypothetical protein
LVIFDLFLDFKPVRVKQLAARPTALDQLNQCIDWSSFEPVLQENLDYKEHVVKEAESPTAHC